MKGIVLFSNNKDTIDIIRFEKYNKGDIVDTKIKFFQNKRMVTLNLV